MNWNYILTIYLKELKDSLRDRRTLISIIVIPTLVMPIMFFGIGKIMSKVMSSAQEEIPSIMLLGASEAPDLAAQLEAARDPDRNRPLFRIVPGTDYKQAIIDKKLRAAVEVPAGFEASLKSGGAATVKIYYFDGEIKSGIGSKALEVFLTNYRQKFIERSLAAHGLPATLVRPFEVKRQNVAPPEKVGGNLFGGFVPYLIIILCFTGAMYPAIDLTAGEKERGTMETLLCSPVKRINIVLGKFLMVLTGSLAAMVFMLASMGLTASIGGAFFRGAMAAKKTAAVAAAAPRVATPVDMIPMIDPAGLVGVLAMVAPVAILFAALLLAISLFAKSYKEAQSYVSPMIIVVIMPAMIGMLPGVELNAKLALVPILNLSLVCKEMLSGVWHWNYIALIFGSSCLYAGVALAFAVRMFNREDVIFRA